MTYQVIITEEVANVAVTSNTYPIIINYNAVIEQAGANTTYGDSNVRTFLASGTNTGNIISTANISGSYILGNGSQLTGLASTYGNANVAANLAAFGSNPITTTGNITAGYFVGNGSLLTGIATSYGNANVAANLAAFGSNPITTTGNITAGNINTTNYVAFGTAGAQTTAATGQMFWDATQQTVSLGMNNGVTQQIGLEQYILVKASSAITNGQAVMFTGANGDNVLAAPADTTSVGFRPEYIIGIATQSIALNGFGYITTFGTVNGLNTNAYTVGDILWVSNSTPGALTATRPADPNYQIEIAAVTKKAGGDGHIQVRVTPFNNIDSLTDVTITTPATGQALVYSGNVWINGNPQQANIANVANSVAGANVSGVVAQATQANAANTATTAGTVTTAAQANITSVGTLTSLSASGNITSSGNISGNFILGNGSLLTGLSGSTYGNANVTTLLSAFGSNTIVTTGNILAGLFNGNGSQLSNISGPNVVGNVSLALFAVNSGVASSANTAGTSTFADTANAVSGANVSGTVASATVAATVTGAAQANITSLGTLTSLSASGNITSSGNISGNFILGDGSQLTNLPATYGNANVATLLSAFGSNTISTTGNVTAGNIVISQANNNIRNVNAWDANTSPQQARITIGTGYDGDFSTTYDPLNATRGAQLAVINKQVIGNADTNQGARAFTASFFADMNGATLTNNNRRMQALGGGLNIGNGTMTLSAGPLYPAVAGGGSGLQIGNIALGGFSTFANTTTSISHGTAGLNNVLIGGNATVGNAVASFSQLQFISNNTGNVRTGISNFLNFTGGSSGQPVPGNVYGVYMPGTTANHGLTNTNFWRVADNYYFLMNEDDAAQVRLGSLRRYHEFESATATSGSFAIDKNTAQVHNIVPTGNCTITGYSNMVTSASDGTNTDSQVDTLTIIVEQGATPYTITLPTGSTYKYAGNISTVGATANAVTMISVTAANVRGVVTYLTTVSPEFV